MKTKIITSIYTDNTGFPFFCHEYQAREERYLLSLKTLNDMGSEIVCFCNETQYERFNKIIQDYKNVTLKISNLKDFPYAKRMEEIKKQNESYNFYHEIDWNKMFLMRKEYDPSYDYMYWIDAGLSHHGLFANKWHPEPEKISGYSFDYNCYSFTKAFNSEFIEKLNMFIGDGLLQLRNANPWHSWAQINHLLGTHFQQQGTAVGGIIGGSINNIEWLINTFFELGEKSLDQNAILNHEAILSAMAQMAPEKFKMFQFTTFYHRDHPVFPNLDGNQICFCDFWDVIFNN